MVAALTLFIFGIAHVGGSSASGADEHDQNDRRGQDMCSSSYLSLASMPRMLTSYV